MTETRVPYRLTAVESAELPGRVLAVLVEQRAAGRRITGKELAHRFGYRDDRQVRLAIGDLIAKGYLILSAVRKPYGYFLSEDLSEVREYLRTQASRLREDVKRVRQIQKNAERVYSTELPLEFGTGKD